MVMENGGGVSASPPFESCSLQVDDPTVLH